MPARSFLDTDVLIYSIAEGDPRSVVSRELLADNGVISVQVMNEFVSVVRRKLQMRWPEVKQALIWFGILCPDPVPLTLDLHEEAVRIAEQYAYPIYDSLIIAAALRSKCGVLYSEDLQDRQVIKGRLTIKNPFR
jgi:predicted nucleic acid-binding protein